MKFYSTKNKKHFVNLKTAVLDSLPPDNGLYMPERIDVLDSNLIEQIEDYGLQDLAYHISHQFLNEDFTDQQIRDIVDGAIDFPAPLINLNVNLNVLELWHGPSLAFKDFGARFMAAVMSRLVAEDDIVLDILVATSGDTGGAVASGFYDVPNIRVTILYPSGKVSYLQEKQLTTLGKNISALEIRGTFDDCQALVKKAFLDRELNNHLHLSSANSINIARLIPQSFYYFEAYKQLTNRAQSEVIFCVPSGNFGNLTAGLIAKKLGLPIHRIIAATNINNVIPRYLESGLYSPQSSFSTISNAMDVGNPSNFQRMLDLFDQDVVQMRKDIVGYYYDDSKTKECMRTLYDTYGYVSDPHGAVGFLACQEYLIDHLGGSLINLETAHPSKFLDIVKEIGLPLDIPERLKELEHKDKSALEMSCDFESFKNYLMCR